jgi:hypothetical protein
MHKVLLDTKDTRGSNELGYNPVVDDNDNDELHLWWGHLGDTLTLRWDLLIFDLKLPK